MIDSVIVGICLMTIKEIQNNDSLVSRKVAYMDDLCVNDDYRRQGIGDKLFDNAKMKALEHGANSIELMVWEFNEDALGFYRRKNIRERSRIRA